MNKTTEALKLAEEAQTPLKDLLRAVPKDGSDLYEEDKFCHHNIPYGRLIHEALAEIERLEVLAKPEITTPDVCGEVCARSKLCYGCGKALDEANAEPVNQGTPYCKSVPMCAKPCGDDSCVEPVKQEPVVFDKWDVDEAKRILPMMRQGVALLEYVAGALPKSAEPVKQESKCNPHPDAPHGFDRNASHSADRYVCECEGWEPDVMDWLSKKPVAVLYVTYGRDPEILATPNVEGFPEGEHELYAEPVDAKAIRAEALEEAAKLCEEGTAFIQFQSKDCYSYARNRAAAIRGLK